jgi:parallel beta-helix repeat protein
MGNVVNARDAGCKLDGHTDDTVALVAAANQAASSGKPLYAPAGVCIVTSASLPSGLTMYGDGIGATTFRRRPAAAPGAVVPVLSFTDGTAITLHDFSIDGNRAGQPNPDVAQSVNLQLAGCSKFFVHDISSQGSQWGMWVAGTKDVVASTQSSIVNCRCFDNGLGIWIFGTVAALTVSSNTVYNNNGGIWFYSPNGADRSITDITCNSNRLDNNGQQGLILWGKGWQGPRSPPGRPLRV